MSNNDTGRAARLAVLNSILTIIFLLGSGVRAQDASDVPTQSIQEALAGSDAKELMKHAGERVEITLLSGGSVYSRGQAIYVMQRFLKEHPPEQVTFERTSEAGGSQFIEGTYQTRRGQTLHLYLRLHHQEGQWQLQELRVRRSPR